MAVSEANALRNTAVQTYDTPLVVTDFASMPELVRWGVVVPPADRFLESRLKSCWAWPDWRAIRSALGNAGFMKAQSTPERRQAVSAVVHTQYG